mmetsp:Transcript_113112/g.316086  ORF Transcript_113112/g.316086 Transcript_113112/m.316086 type:complete len:207 (-) Transcript_113112:485-1105(-)
MDRAWTVPPGFVLRGLEGAHRRHADLQPRHAKDMLSRGGGGVPRPGAELLHPGALRGVRQVHCGQTHIVQRPGGRQRLLDGLQHRSERRLRRLPRRHVHARGDEGAGGDPQRRRRRPVGDGDPTPPGDGGNDRHRARKAEVLRHGGPVLQDVVAPDPLSWDDGPAALPLLLAGLDHGGAMGRPLTHPARADLLPVRVAEAGERQLG